MNMLNIFSDIKYKHEDGHNTLITTDNDVNDD